MHTPTPLEIKQARLDSGFTQAQAGALIHKTSTSWHIWESGTRNMDAIFFELFKMKVAASLKPGAPAEPPTKEEVRAARESANMTLRAAAATLGRHISIWQYYESGRSKMDPALYEYFLIKTGQLALNGKPELVEDHPNTQAPKPRRPI